MKRNLLPIFIFLFSFNMVSAQALSISPVNPVDSFLTSAFSSKVSGYIQNDSTVALNLRWERVVDSLATGWQSAVCDPNLCWAQWIDTKDFTLAAGAQGDFSITFYPGGNAGTSKATLRVYVIGDSANTVIENTYYGTANFPVNTFEIEQEKIKIFPNPATSYFQLTSVKNVDKIVLYSIVGSRVKSFNVSSKSDRFNIANLPRGMYLVRLMDDDGEVMQTIRMSKR